MYFSRVFTGVYSPPLKNKIRSSFSGLPCLWAVIQMEVNKLEVVQTGALPPILVTGTVDWQGTSRGKGPVVI